ncbi:hypothetical protein PR048_003935 [Dryococelus australis]|uniref:MADF domain-containing protein n=1 Tax=Dryococelus australis TaxID=614101 RepID=A0ABQ9I435_9NEOP|nr:hypothetical protein PR048_003935 [Dryococelus australis]
MGDCICGDETRGRGVLVNAIRARIQRSQCRDCGWNTQHELYCNKVTKHDAWVNIAKQFGCSAAAVKKKMYRMLASFHRDKVKGKRSVGTGREREIQSQPEDNAANQIEQHTAVIEDAEVLSEEPTMQEETHVKHDVFARHTTKHKSAKELKHNPRSSGALYLSSPLTGFPFELFAEQEENVPGRGILDERSIRLDKGELGPGGRRDKNCHWTARCYQRSFLLLSTILPPSVSSPVLPSHLLQLQHRGVHVCPNTQYLRRRHLSARYKICMHNKLHDAYVGDVKCGQRLYVGHHVYATAVTLVCGTHPTDIQVAPTAACSTDVDQFAFVPRNVLCTLVHTAADTRRRMPKFNILNNVSEHFLTRFSYSFLPTDAVF